MVDMLKKADIMRKARYAFYYVLNLLPDHLD